MKKAVISFIIVAIFAGVIFLVGWIQLAVPAGKYGVIISKTGGIDHETVIPGQFRWTWERLLPTNTTVLVFDLSPVTKKLDIEGTLPSGAVYGAMLEGKPEFSWKATVAITGHVSVSRLPELVRQNGIRDQKALDAWTGIELASVAGGGVRQYINKTLADPETAGSLAANADALFRNEKLEILSVEPSFLTEPDFALYRMAAKAYGDYQARREELLSKAVVREADSAVAEYLQMERLARWGEVLTKYPILIDYLAVTRDDDGAAFSAVRNLGKSDR
jgi:hypothetical protein